MADDDRISKLKVCNQADQVAAHLGEAVAVLRPVAAAMAAQVNRHYPVPWSQVPGDKVPPPSVAGQPVQAEHGAPLPLPFPDRKPDTGQMHQSLLRRWHYFFIHRRGRAQIASETEDMKNPSTRSGGASTNTEAPISRESAISASLEASSPSMMPKSTVAPSM